MRFPKHFETEFEGDAEQIREVRRFVIAVLARVPGLPDDLVDDAALCACELATNAYKHTMSGWPNGTFIVRIEVTRAYLHIEVVDQGTLGTTPARQPGTAGEAESGRGLDIVARLGALDHAPAGPGLRVWVVLARPVDPTPDPAAPVDVVDPAGRVERVDHVGLVPALGAAQPARGGVG